MNWKLIHVVWKLPFCFDHPNSCIFLEFFISGSSFIVITFQMLQEFMKCCAPFNYVSYHSSLLVDFVILCFSRGFCFTCIVNLIDPFFQLFLQKYIKSTMHQSGWILVVLLCKWNALNVEINNDTPLDFIIKCVFLQRYFPVINLI